MEKDKVIQELRNAINVISDERNFHYENVTHELLCISFNLLSERYKFLYNIPDTLNVPETEGCRQLVDILERCKDERKQFDYTIQFIERYFYIEIKYFGKSIDFQKVGYYDLEYQKEMICELFLSKYLDIRLLNLMFTKQNDIWYDRNLRTFCFIEEENKFYSFDDCNSFTSLSAFESILEEYEFNLSE